jgi:hypothetical protein
MLAILSLAISCYLNIYEFVISSALETAPKATTSFVTATLAPIRPANRWPRLRDASA